MNIPHSLPSTAGGLLQTASRTRPCRNVLMVGTALDGTGGIRAVVQGYIDAGLFERYPCRYVATHRYTHAAGKIWAALRGWLRVAWLLCTLDAPLVHVQTASRASFWRKSVVCLMARSARRPYLLHVHGGEFLDFYSRECGPLAQRFIRHIFGRAALVIAVSEGWRERLTRICPTATIEVVANGVPLPPVRERAAAAAPMVLFLGDVTVAKGAFDLVRAFAKVAKSFPQLRLVLGGTGALDEVAWLAAALAVGSRVQCPGWLGRAAKDAALAAATVLVLPSYAEGMPMAVLEAMAAAIPVVATRVGGIPQVVQDGVNGVLVQPGDVAGLAHAIGTLIADPALRARLGAQARATIAREFSSELTIARLESIYRRFGVPERAAP